MEEKKEFKDILFKDEVFFADPEAEYKYFEKRMKNIGNYSNSFFKERAIENLISRYIKALASLKDDYESSSLGDTYRDCLIQLGVDDYCIDSEVENYKITHSNNQTNVIVSSKARK